ncbi:Peptidoglycan/LPS O-acetylase OafA/YrhL, contains acyltransferase and SGNH-hydrolase domains [Roseateles sp. YR242]|uniref:acyltransferase family protein n=1 Tax=Roseateles sp. YR242 TaxID=1855305 RepID=UPI0008D5712C|nr:acyltransferase [Roseateles sp. YR242]SEL74255.1 Peptidoglycan/LPS O-acetylase OafA/YrhL, contains acyltransferase and SGNH-hydrolase domains [Roseateles sp. YR242]
MPNSKDREIVGLQALRAVAALAVVIHHALRATTVKAPEAMHLGPSVFPDWLVEAGAGGVDVFFILSGFLMVYISGSYVEGRRPVSHFLQQRVLRVWPMYALVTLFALKPALLQWYATGERGFSLSAQRLGGFLFLPSFNEHHYIQPIVGVGWTLSYEALFYLCFAAAIVVARRQLFGALCTILAAAFVLGQLLPEASVWHGFLSDPITLEFLFGAAIAKFVNWKGRHIAVSIAMIAAGAVLFATASYLGLMNTPWRPLSFGVAAALIFIGVLRLEDRVQWPKLVVLLGNASYSIYLVHVLVIYQGVMPYAERAIRKFDLSLGADLVAVLLVGGGVVAGVLCYFLLEKPLTVLLMRQRNGKRRPELPVSMTRP